MVKKKSALFKLELNRKELLAKLQMVAPALSDKELIPVLTHFWFSGDKVMAFNDQIAIQTKLKTNFTGAVPGQVLLELLNKSDSPEVRFTLTGDSLLMELGKTMKAGFKTRTHIDLKVLPVSDFSEMHQMPEVSEDDGIKGTEAFRPAINCCMPSISNDTSIPDQLGLTVIPNGKYLHMYATNNQTLSHAEIPLKTKLPGRVILSKPFCEQLIELTKDRAFQLVIESDSAIVEVPGHATLFGRLVSSEHPLDFGEIMKEHLPDGPSEDFIRMPNDLKSVLDRALIITDTKMEETKALIKVKGGTMTVESKSSRGEMNDRVYDKEGYIKDHPDISVRLNPRLMKEGCERYDNMLVTESCAIMTIDKTKDPKAVPLKAVYLVSATN